VRGLNEQELAARFKYMTSGYNWEALDDAEQRLLANIYARTQDWKTITETYRSQL